MAKWNTVNGLDGCGYKYTQHVLESKVASAKVWSRYSGELNYNFDTDHSPSISGTLKMPGVDTKKLVEFGKKFITQLLLPEYVKVRKPTKKVARKGSSKKASRKATKKVQLKRGLGNTKQALSLRASRQTRDSRGRFA